MDGIWRRLVGVYDFLGGFFFFVGCIEIPRLSYVITSIEGLMIE